MGYKSDHEFRTDLWKEVTRGLPSDLARKAHEHLGKHYKEEKNDMDYSQLLAVVQEVMSNYQEWSWNGQRWYQ
jgi:hypothetical protein